MGSEIKVTIGCDYNKGNHHEQFGIPLRLAGVPRLASNNAKYLDVLFQASGVDQTADGGFDSGMVTIGTGIFQLDTYNNLKITTNSWMFLKNTELAPSGSYVEWGPRVRYVSCSDAITMTGPDGAVVYNFEAEDGDYVVVPIGRIEAGESAAFRLVPSGLSFGFQAGSGLLDIEDSTPGSDVAAKIKYILFND